MRRRGSERGCAPYLVFQRMDGEIREAEASRPSGLRGGESAGGTRRRLDDLNRRKMRAG